MDSGTKTEGGDRTMAAKKKAKKTTAKKTTKKK
jgi:hypothetical protein